jgi:Sulfotransferase family
VGKRTVLILADRVPGSKRKLFFLHVRKTGGAALTGAISQRFSRRECQLLYYPPEPSVYDLDGFRYVSGHVPLSFLDRFRDRPFVFTLLRDPVERALSAYSFLRTRPPGFERQMMLFGRGPQAYERARVCLQLARRHSIGDFIERAPEIAIEYFGNQQARALGDADPEGGDERLEDGLAGLQRCDFVGLAERLDESASLLVRRLGWREVTPLPRTNVTTVRLRRDQVSQRELDALLELTSIDRELYRHGVERYERQLTDWGALGNPRDPTAEVADAPPVSDLHFDEAIQGGGWVGRELTGNEPAVCWIGHTNTAWADLASDRAASAVVVEIAHVLDQAILGSLRISVNGRRMPHHLEQANGVVVAIAPLPWLRRRLRGRTTRVTLHVDRSTRACDVDPASSDDRELSIAVRRIALVRPDLHR